MRLPVMTTTISTPDHHTVVATVEHAACQSYSRAVHPAARHAVRAHLGGGRRWRLERVCFHDEENKPVPGQDYRLQRVRTSYIYRPVTEPGAIP